MSNEQVIVRFLEQKKAKTALRSIGYGFYAYKGRTLETDGKELINYSTVIAYVKEGKLYLNTQKYSQTTSKIQSQLKRLALKYYKPEDILEY